MTTIAAPTRARARRPAPPARRTSTSARRPVRVQERVAVAPRLHVGRMSALLALFTVFALVSAVVFHVVLAQHQMQLDHLNTQIAKEQRTYEQRRLTASLLASPSHVIQEAERLGLVVPDQPAQYLYADNAPMPETGDGATVGTIADWSKTKPSLGPRQP